MSNFDSSPLTYYSHLGAELLFCLINKNNISPYLTEMAKGSLSMLGGEAVKFCRQNINLVLHGSHPLRVLGLDPSDSIKSFQNDLKSIWRYI